MVNDAMIHDHIAGEMETKTNELELFTILE